MRQKSPTIGEKICSPNFNKCNILSYYDFKDRWINEVRLERQSKVRELANLKEALPQLTWNKLTEVKKLKDAWKVLDNQYGDLKKIRAKLKSLLRLKPHQVHIKREKFRGDLTHIR